MREREPGAALGSREAWRWRELASPLGPLLVVTCGAELARVDFRDGRSASTPPSWMQSDQGAETPGSVFRAVEDALDRYWRGEPMELSVPLRSVGTGFQRAVWEALTTIPYGETRTYGEVAAAIGRPRAVRAVGAAIGANPWSVVVPCHRVIGRDGRLTGYGGGLNRKAWLLAHEASSGRHPGDTGA